MDLVKRSGIEDGFVPAAVEPPREPPSRRDLLKMGVGLAAVGLLGVAGLSCGETMEDTAVSAHSLGIKPANTARTNRENLVKALTNSNRKVGFPAGDYRIDNSGTPPIVRNFGGGVSFEAGARFVFTDNRTKGLLFEGGTGARFYGLRTTFSTLPPVRVAGNTCLHFTETTDTLVQNVVIDGSAGAGLLFGRCVRPYVENATIRNTRADGLHFAGCGDVRVNKLRTNNTGDDGLAFLDYGGATLHGGYATDIVVQHAEARGITVVGQRDIEVNDFLIDGTTGAGIYVAHEVSYSTGTPRNVHYHDGEVVRAGTIVEANGRVGANRFSIFYNGVTDLIRFSRIVSRCPAVGHVRTGGQSSKATLTDITAAPGGRPTRPYGLRGGRLR